MGYQLQPSDIADCYSLAEIETRISEIKSAVSDATNIANYKFDDMQASQSVRSQTLKDLREELAVYVKAKNILTGADSSYAELISADYNRGIPIP